MISPRIVSQIEEAGPGVPVPPISTVLFANTNAIQGECEQAAGNVLSRPVRYRWAAVMVLGVLVALGHAHWETILGWWGR